MAGEMYKINILHYANPHLIWVKVIDEELNETDLQQIGIYGVLPMLPKIDMIHSCLTSERVDEWPPAATEVMKKILHNAETIMFQPIFIDRTNSIFELKIHKFGDIIITKYDGQKVKFTEALNKTIYSISDEKTFLKKLENCDLHTVLDYKETAAVIKTLNEAVVARNQKPHLSKIAKNPEVDAYPLLTLTEDNLLKHNTELEEEEVEDHKESLLEAKLNLWKIAHEKAEKASNSDKSEDSDHEVRRENENLMNSKLHLIKKLQEHKAAKKNEALSLSAGDIKNSETQENIDNYNRDLIIPDIIPKFVPKQHTLYNKIQRKSRDEESYHEMYMPVEQNITIIPVQSRKTQVNHFVNHELKKSMASTSSTNSNKRFNDNARINIKYKNSAAKESSVSQFFGSKSQQEKSAKNDGYYSEGNAAKESSVSQFFGSKSQQVNSAKNDGYYIKGNAAKESSVSQFFGSKSQQEKSAKNDGYYSEGNAAKESSVSKFFGSKWQQEKSAKNDGYYSKGNAAKESSVSQFFGSKSQQEKSAKNDGYYSEGNAAKESSVSQFFGSKSQQEKSAKNDGYYSEGNAAKESSVSQFFGSKSQQEKSAKNDGYYSEGNAAKESSVSQFFGSKSQQEKSAENDGYYSESNAAKESSVSQFFGSKSQQEKSAENDGYYSVSNAAKESSVSQAVVDSKTSLRFAKLMDMKNKLTRKLVESNIGNTKPFIIPKDDFDNETTISYLHKILKLDDVIVEQSQVEVEPKITNFFDVNYVNVFRNVDKFTSKFIDNVVNPVLIVHTKNNNRIEPVSDFKDISFTNDIRVALRRMSITQPMLLQTVSWPCILRGYSIFMISPLNSGKTMGFIPPVCRLISDFEFSEGKGPLAIIVCATAKSVVTTQKRFKLILGRNRTVLSCYAGCNERDIATMLLNGCDIFISTPCALVRLLSSLDSVLDLNRLSICVLDDCERLDKVYLNELKYVLLKIKDMLANRMDKVHNVQFILASRNWCGFMENFAKKVANSVVSISSFQESVVYSKAHTSVSFVESSNKTKVTMDFIKEIDNSKRTVIVCSTNAEVDSLSKMLKELNYVVFAADNSMTTETLYKLYDDWTEYDAPFVGAVLVCCDENLVYLNVTNASHLIHYSLPNLFSTFCKRFAALTDNYSSIFENSKSNIKIKILIEETNAEQVPKILNFIKRCTDNIPEVLEKISSEVIKEKELCKARSFVPICNKLLSFGECFNYWSCRERHSVFAEFDTPPHWVPTKGVIYFVILTFRNAATYTSRLVTHISDGNSTKFAQAYTSLSLKMDMYYMNENNRRPLGVAQIGDICAVSTTSSHYQRCQVTKILTRYDNGCPQKLVIKLIDEEIWETTRDVYLFHLPEEFRKVETYVVQVKLSGVQPKDRDLMFSDLAKKDMMQLVDDDALFMRGNIIMTIGNTIIVDSLEACQEISALNEIVVRHNFKEELLSNHACVNEDHIIKLRNLCAVGTLNITPKDESIAIEVLKEQKLPEPQWAHLNEDESLIYFASAETPDKFYIRLEKFRDCLGILTKDIEMYLKDNEPVKSVNLGDYVLAQFPDDEKHYRARIDELTDTVRVKCFFVDYGDWRFVCINNVFAITEQFITRLPFQAIECRLVGLKPCGESWSEFSTNYLCDLCFVGSTDDLKDLYVNYFMKEKAESTGGHKYAITMIDTTADKDVIINQALLEANLANVNDDEIQYIKELKRGEVSDETSKTEDESEFNDIEEVSTSVEIYEPKKNVLKAILTPQRSLPLVGDDDDMYDEWDVELDSENGENPTAAFGFNFGNYQNNKPELQAIQPQTISQVSSNSFEMITPINKIEELDSDDLTSPEICSLNSTLSSLSSKKPKLLWTQNDSSLMIKIEIIGMKNYTVNIEESSLEFSAKVDGNLYEFYLELYGAVNVDKCTHTYRGIRVYIKLVKLLKLNWFGLCKNHAKNKWISYDPDFIDTSSDDNDDNDEYNKELVKKIVISHDDISEAESDISFQDDFARTYHDL